VSTSYSVRDRRDRTYARVSHHDYRVAFILMVLNCIHCLKILFPDQHRTISKGTGQPTQCLECFGNLDTLGGIVILMHSEKGYFCATHNRCQNCWRSVISDVMKYSSDSVTTQDKKHQESSQQDKQSEYTFICSREIEKQIKEHEKENDFASLQTRPRRM
jgi:hypothetical protein